MQAYVMFMITNLIKPRMGKLILQSSVIDPTQKIKFFIKDFFSKCDQIRSFLRIWSHLLKKSLMKNCFFYAVRLLDSYFSLTDFRK